MKKEHEHERERLGLNGGGPQVHDNLPSGGVHGHPSMGDLMRRRRADQTPFGLHTVGGDVNVSGAASMSDPLGMEGMDQYGLSMAAASGMESMGGAGYGHHHYVQQHQQHQQHPQDAAFANAPRTGMAPISPVTPISPADTLIENVGYSANASAMMQPGAPGSIGAYYDSLAAQQQQTGEYDERKPSPTPRNQLPPDATLCSPFSAQALPGGGH